MTHEARHELFLSRIREGDTVRAAAQHAGVMFSVIWNRVKRDPDFRKAYEDAQEQRADLWLDDAVGLLDEDIDCNVKLRQREASSRMRIEVVKMQSTRYAPSRTLDVTVNSTEAFAKMLQAMSAPKLIAAPVPVLDAEWEDTGWP